MKSILSIVLISLITFSCAQNDNSLAIEHKDITGTWELSKILNGSVGGEFAPENNKTHRYVFNSNKTFERVEVDNEQVVKLTGTFTITDQHHLYQNLDSNYAKYIELTYISNSNFFNCNTDYTSKQLLILNTSNELLNTLPMACDGNGFKYTKKE